MVNKDTQLQTHISVVETGSNTQGAVEPEYDSQEESPGKSLVLIVATVESDTSDAETRDFPS